MADQDRRRQPRCYLRIEGILIVSGPAHPVVTVDISEDGIGVEARQSFEPGTRVTVEVGDADKERFTFRGKVVWCVQDESGGLPIYRMGMITDMIGASDLTAVTQQEKSEMLGRIVGLYSSPRPFKAN